jgi:hypothetical protein
MLEYGVRDKLASKLYRLVSGTSIPRQTTNIFLQPGHFYSPLPDLDDIREREAELFGEQPSVLGGIDTRDLSQLKLLETFATFYAEMPFKPERVPGMRAYLDNPRYAFLDAITLYCMLRHLTPRRVIEIGSGYSSCVTLDTNELFLNNATEIIFIEPYPDVLFELLDKEDAARGKVMQKKLQDVDPELFKSLKSGDILFVDSTHVAKIGSDVTRLMFTIFPLLASGVTIHIHDIFYPFEYPKEWVYEGRAWNEAYLLRAFLSNNSRYEIVFWNDYISKFYRGDLERCLPLGLKNSGGAIWLRKK